MADEPADLDLGVGDDGAPVVLIGDDREAADMVALLRLQPGLASAVQAADLARAVNHFAHGSEYRVITDPKGFADAYRAQLAQEDPDAAWQEGVIRLRDYGVPDFAEILAPSFSDGRLVFFAFDEVLGLPYRVDAVDPSAPPTYAPLRLTPVAGPSHAGGKPDLTPAKGRPIGQTGKRR